MTANGIDDSGRPPVLAQQRYAADRAAFAGLSLAQRFQRIHDTNLWGAGQSVSRLAITSLLDAPCGDGGWRDKSLGM